MVLVLLQIYKKELVSMYDYEPYREMLKRRNVKQSQLINDGIINRNNASSLKQNKALTTDTLEKLCNYFDCQFNDLVRHYKE